MNHDDQFIHQLLSAPVPHMIGRIAGVELKVAYYVLEQSHLIRDQDLMELENNAGIHITSNESLKEYATRLIEAYEACSVIGTWETSGKVYELTGAGQDFIARRTPHVPKISALSLEPYYLPPIDLSWMTALKGKRILILHPFVYTIKKQLDHLKEIYPGRNWFNECSFDLIRPPFTLAGNHGHIDWKDHYEKCIIAVREAYEKQPFQVALIGAGGYGMLLSHFLYKELQVSTIYVGGALQLFFGVIGKRWFTNKRVMGLVNDAWTRPLTEDKPSEFQRVEKGCYW
jgi:hypothetical protein